MKIEMGRTYRTRDGREVRIYAVDGGSEFCVHGAILFPSGVWHQRCWPITGVIGSVLGSDADLVEVRPRIKREFWVNVYPHRIGSPNSSEGYAKAHRGADAIACVRVEIDVEEGHGL